MPQDSWTNIAHLDPEKQRLARASMSRSEGYRRICLTMTLVGPKDVFPKMEIWLGATYPILDDRLRLSHQLLFNFPLLPPPNIVPPEYLTRQDNHGCI
jgi:hypothetical protein